MKRFALILTLIFLTCLGYAQQDAHYSQYMFNGLVLNPAYAGSRGSIAANVFVRKQWFGIQGAPFTQAFNFDMSDPGKRHGFGLSVTNDRIGYINQQWANVSYAYGIPIGQSKLALGLQGGLLNYRIDWGQAQVLDPNDASIPGNQRNLLMPNVGAGAYFHSRLSYLGISFPHILNAELPKNQGTPANNAIARLYRHIYFTGGHLLNENGSVKVKPSFLFKYVKGAPLQYDINLSLLFVDKLWLGLSWRSMDALVFMTEVNIGEKFRVGYGYDLTISGLREFTSGSHEIFLGIEFEYKDVKLKSPRYF